MNDEGYFSNGFMQALTFGTHHSRTAEEVESYMLGTSIEGYAFKKFGKFAGKVLGSPITWVCTAVGAVVGGPVGAGIGAAIGTGINLLGAAIFGHQEPSKVTDPY